MKIYSILGVKIADVPVQSNAEHERELMKSNFVRLEWSQSSLLELPCGTYIEYNGIKYRLLKDYKPEQQSTQQWDYSPEFQHPIMMLGTILFILVTGDTTSWQSADKETEWNWTGMAINLIQEAFVPFLNKYGADNPDIGTGWTAVVDSDLKASETCTFQSMDFLSALSHAAQQFECEWHLDYENKILYFGHINITTSELVFEVGNNIDKPTIRENNEGYYNAYIAKGSTRNISQVNDKGENIQLNKRLTLNPEKYPDGYIDRRKSDKEPLVVKELIYDDIYPSLDLYIYNPRARTRYLLDSNTGERIEDKNDPTGYKRYSIWYVRLAYQINGEWKDFNFSKDMLIGNLSCQFQGNETSTKYTSPLAGLEFELKYHESDYIIPADPVTGDTGITIKKGDYEIIYDESNGLIIPTTVEGGMCPLGDREQSKQNNILRLYNIAFPSEYVSKAQEELEKQALEDISYWESDRNNYEFNSNPVAFKADMPELFIGRGVVYKNGEYELRTRISKLVQKIDFPYEVEITVGNEEIKGSTTTMREQLQMVVSAMNNGMGGMSVEQFKKMLNIYASQIFDGRFLSKLNPDTARGIITFLQGTNWGSFTSETGATMTVDPNTGQTYMEVDRLKVRLKAFFEQLEIQKVGFVGGKLIVTKGQGVDILDVENIYDTEGNVSAYRCYFLGEQEGRKIDNLLRVKDQMICKDFNVSEGSTDGATNKYYWRLATAVSSEVVKRGNNMCHWVDLSATDCDTNSDIPEIGDTICHLGNREDTDRQGAEILSVVDANSPSFTIYSGINSYSLVNKEYIDMGVVNGKAYCNIYGSTYIGDRERQKGYLRWNDDTKTFEIKGTIDITSPLSSGGTIGGAIDDAANAYKGEFDAFTSNVNEVIGGFQAQIDGVIETWFYEPEPTLGNPPASEWTDNTTKDKHLGDLYYSGEGKAYRFQKEGDNYVWQPITDTDIAKALEEAKKANDAANAAQGTADSKMRVFVVQPTAEDEYSVGDMWVNATYPADGSTYNKEILHCVTAKDAGKDFDISHWAQSSNIKTQFNNFVNNTYAEDKEDFYNQLDGKVETWYQSSDPKNSWAAADYSKHTGDIWYDNSTNKAYRWTGTAWVELKDQAAIDAKALAESKRRVFTTTTLPTPPYDARDLWVQGENGDIMVCVKEKASGATASASDWEKASKYTDDTKANEALTKVGDLQTDVTELGESFNTLTNTTLPALSDGIITTSEKENIRQALMQVQKECVDVINAYTNLTVNYKSIYDKIAADVRTNFATAYTNLMGSATLSSDGIITYTSGQGGAYGALVDNINALLNKEGNLTTNEIATINNNIANFNIKYNDFQNRLVVVRNDIEKTLDTRITDVDEQLGGYAYLKKIVGGKTTIDGGLVLTTMLGTGYEVTGGAYKIMSGISGLYETAKSVAIWAGGSMIDKFVYYDAESGKFNVPADVNPANFLVRMDGTGYAAGGNFWWDNDGKIHADPQSFLINEQYVGNVMQLFQLHYKVAGDTAFTNVDYVTPTRMFNGLELSDLGLKIGDTAKFYIKDGVLFLEGDLAVTGGITMYASDGVTSGLLDQVYAILDSSKFEIENGVITIKGDIGDGKVKGATLGGVAVTLSANGILEFDAYPTTLPASDVYAWAKAATKPTYSWGEITEKPSSFTPSAHTHDDRYYTESEIDAKLDLKLDTSLKGAADGLATLDASGKVPSSQLPSYVDDVLEYANKASFPSTGESGKIYIDKATNLTYRWSGSSYVEISQSLALGETSSTAYAGDKGKKNAEDIAALQTGKADKATTLSGYGITDAYTKTEVNTKLTDGSVTKIGTKDVGSATLPIYLKAGVPTAVGTSLAVDITGNSATATKLANARTLWGQSFDGSANVSGDMTGVGTITPMGEDLKVVGNLIVTGGIVMYADDGATIESGFAALLAAHIDGVTIKYNEAQQKIYSVMTGIKVNGATYKPSETDGYITIPDYPTSLDWANIENKPSTFTPASHTHTFASLTSKPTTLSGYGITDAKIANGVITLGTATITPLTAHQTVTLASGTNNGTLKLTVGSTTTDNIAVKGLGSAAYTASSAYAAASHTHSQYLVASSLDGYVNALTDNTSTNVFVTAIAKSGKTLSYTKSFTKKSLSEVSHSGWSSADTDKLIIPDMSFIAYWNGAYNSSGSSHLAYCNKGAFGDMATASKSSYYTNTEVDTKLTDGSVTKLGTATVGSGTKHFYLNEGTATASTSTVGGTAKPMYLNAGVMTAISATVGSASKPVYLNGGSVTACSYDFTSYLPLAGGKMGGTAWIVWPDSGNWGNSNSGVTFPVTRGGLHWIGQSDWVKLFSQETGNDNLNLVLQFGDDNSNGLSIRNNGGSQTAFIAATGHITAANTTVNGTLKVGAIPVTNSSSGVLKIDGSLIVTGGITMYATDGVASGLMEQILVDGTTIGKKADGTLYAINTGNVRSIIMGSTTYTPNSSGAVTLPEKVTWANIEGKPSTFTPSAHTHSSITIPVCSSLNGNSGVFSVEYAGGGNSVATKPSGVDAFGVMRLRTATGWYGQIMMSSNTAPGIYYRNANGLTSSVGWEKLLDSGNFGDYAAAKSHTHAISDITNLQATLDGKAAASHTHSYLPLAGGTMTGALNVRTGGIWVQGGSEAGSDNTRMSLVSGMPSELAFNTSKRGVRIYSNAIAFADPYNGNTNNDSGWIRHIETSANAGVLEIAVGDDAANESIVVRRYNTSSAVANEAYLLNSSGNTSFPGTVSAPTFSGALSGNASSASYASSAGNADTLDGNHASAFATASHTHAYLPLSGGHVNGEITFGSVGSYSTSYGSIVNYDGHLHINIRDYKLCLSKMGTNGLFLDISDIASTVKQQKFQNKDGYIALTSDLSAYLPLAGGTMTGDILAKDIRGVDNSNRIIFRHLDGQYCYGNYDLYLQYHQSSSVIYLNGDTYKIYNGGANYNGTSAYALNADTVDGYHASYFMPTPGGSFTGVVKFTNTGYSRLLYIDGCAIGFNRNTTVGGRFDGSIPGYQLHVDNSDKHLWLGCEYDSWIVCVKFDCYGNVVFNGGITMYSDLRKKNILSDEVLSVKEIAAAPLFKHTYKSDDNQYIHIGTSAQYWSGIHEDWFTRKDGEGYYQMELQNLGVAMGISLAREIVKYESKTDKKIRLMKKRINELEARVKELEERRSA